MDDRDIGRDDGIKCKCGGSTFLVDDQGGGLRSYQCDVCGQSFQVQFETDEPTPDYDPESDEQYEDD